MASDRSTNGAARTASETIAERVRADIANGKLQPGEMLPSESALLARYDVARSTMREALRILESDGLVTIERGTKGGARVQDLTVTALARRVGLHLQVRGTVLDDLIQVQAAVQPRAAALAAAARTDDDLRRLRDAVAAAAASTTVDEYLAAVGRLVHCLVRASGNPVMALFTELTQELQDAAMADWLTEIDARSQFSHAFFADQAERYATLVDLIERGDADGAEDFWRAYLEERGVVQRDHPAPLRVYPDG